jgi:hypothetical protein
MMDEFFRTLAKKQSHDSEELNIDHKNTHRLIRKLIKHEVTVAQEGGSTKFHFTKKIADILRKDLASHLKRRGVFVICSIIENDETKSIMEGDIKEQKKLIMKMLKDDPKMTGLKILQEKIWS